ncbi:aspartic proteinase-like protein 1 isoform X2 [Prosopis cineraria]|uniref:aspartic proteinase-like protein 1 isoform X2 n=1 Tax=Prosopis cineraria TaxID=364024 RepID=UPI00240F2E53|nr:aspartic proteinase-like protein 1 isoform X2 [Prosopis cineraria]
MAFRFVLCLLLAKGLVEGMFGLTFSSKLIHVYSDEAKAIWVSRSKNLSAESWPKRNSSEYFRLLLGSDLTRQRMKLGSQYDFLYPSEGSETLFFGDDLYWLHYTWIDIGTPNVSFLVALDAGSDLLWVPCDCIECAPLSANYYNGLDRDLSEYSPSLSSTSRHLPCSHQLCNPVATCESPREACSYNSKYYSANTSSSGLLIEDKLHLESHGKHAAQSSLDASIILGCGRKQSGEYLVGAAPDGVMGLGPGSISVPSLLAKAGLIKDSFSFCLNENDSGRILFGDQGHASQQYTPFLPIDGEFAAYVVGVESFCVGSSYLKKTGFQALIDTGTSFTYLPDEVYKLVVSEFDKHVNASRVVLRQYPWEYCYKVSSHELDNIPTLKLTFSRNQTFRIHYPMYTTPSNQEYTIACLTIVQTDDDYGTIGQNFLKGYHMIFDRENLRFGWSSSNCEDSTGDEANFTAPWHGGSPNPLPANQQQSIPNTHSVPPAFAGPTLPKPAGAPLGCMTASHFLSLLSLVCSLLFWLSN